MVPYTATEKDCTDEDGKEAECIICLEDYEAGDKMARLVCWCKFHEVCPFFSLPLFLTAVGNRAREGVGEWDGSDKPCDLGWRYEY